jgi:hypothetical protein
MFLRRRRPLAAAAMIGGTAYVAHKAGEKRAYDEMQEQSQEARLETLEAQQAQTAPVPAPVGASAGDEMLSRLKELQALKDQGTLSDEEFQAVKAKIISG